MRELHFPASPEEGAAAREALAYSEFLLFEIQILMRRARLASSHKGHAYSAEDVLPALESRLGFSLTPGQAAAWGEIRGALASSLPMQRLLMGDVGSGKTVIAALAILTAARSGLQAALAAPTVILAHQVYERLAASLSPLGVRCLFMHGGQGGEERRKARESLAGGEADLVVGTHVLFQEDIAFKSLGLVLIDEQHRFGVRARSSLREKGAQADYLAMSATPIPRTLALSLYGDFELTSIKDRPAGRHAIATRIASSGEDIRRAYQELEERIMRGEQGYLVYPAIGGCDQEGQAQEEDAGGRGGAKKRARKSKRAALPSPRPDEAPEEGQDARDGQATQDALAAGERMLLSAYETLLRSPLAGRIQAQNRGIALLHGRLNDEEKMRVMRAFACTESALALLVSTSVIEVGIDNPNANIILIHGAERFGLSQLHQLRGRVGRGAAKASCYLICSEGAGEAVRRRLQTLEDSQDGFYIAEADLALRGPGDFLGTSQAGLPHFKAAELARDFHLLALAKQDAEFILQRDPFLLSEHNAPLARLCRQEQEEGGYE
jgi:ATP-dependent DNA helicase RecG